MNARIWWKALRPFTYTVSIFPPIIGTVIAAYSITFSLISWGNVFLCILGCIASHAGANLLSDYFDYIKNVDRAETLGSNRYLIEKHLTPKEVFFGAIIAYFIAVLIGGYFVFTIQNGFNFIWLIALGGFLGICYTAGPFELKYHALGDLAVFIAFGSAMSSGAYFIQTAHFSWAAAIYIIPVSLLVVAILHSNNIRDLEHDSAVGIKTIAILFGEKKSQLIYTILVTSSYFSTILLIAFFKLPILSLLILLSAPLAIKNIQKVATKSKWHPQQFATIDADTAKLHFLFALLMVCGAVINYFYQI